MGKHENIVVKDCEAVLLHFGIPHYRNNVGAQKTAKRFFRYGAPGWPDLIGLLPTSGRLIGVECKAVNPLTKRKGTQTPDQVRVADEISAAGGLYILCFDSETLRRVLIGEGLKPSRTPSPQAGVK